MYVSVRVHMMDDATDVYTKNNNGNDKAKSIRSSSPLRKYPKYK